MRATLGQAGSVEATELVRPGVTHRLISRTSHSESGSAAQGIRREGDTARIRQAQATESQTVSVALRVNVALGPGLQPDSTPGPLPNHTLLGQLQLEGGTAPFADCHIFQRLQYSQLPRWCGRW